MLWILELEPITFICLSDPWLHWWELELVTACEISSGLLSSATVRAQQMDGKANHQSLFLLVIFDLNSMLKELWYP